MRTPSAPFRRVARPATSRRSERPASGARPARPRRCRIRSGSAPRPGSCWPSPSWPASSCSPAHTQWLGFDDRANTGFLRLLAKARTPWLTDVAGGIKAAGSGWGVTALGLAVVALIMIFRRWRHLLVFLGALFFLEITGEWIYSGLSRPRPYGIAIISNWGGYSAPSPPVAVLTIFLMGAVYGLVVPGRPRAYAKTAVAVLVAVFCLARLYLAVDHPDDVLLGVALGVAIPVTAFRYFTPNEVFPVVYRRGRAADVDVGGPRGDAIRLASTTSSG